jgi:hypothetical protein
VKYADRIATLAEKFHPEVRDLLGVESTARRFPKKKFATFLQKRAVRSRLPQLPTEITNLINSDAKFDVVPSELIREALESSSVWEMVPEANGSGSTPKSNYGHNGSEGSDASIFRFRDQPRAW